MNIKRFLCEIFNKRNKKYVTIGDIISVIIYTVFIIGIIYVFTYSIFSGVNLILSNSCDKNNLFCGNVLGMFGATIILLFAVFIALFIIVIISKLFEFIMNIKVIKCDLKEKEEDNK